MSEHNAQLLTLLQSLNDNHAIDITVIDVRQQTSITDYMIICSGRSSRQVHSIAENVMLEMKHKGIPAIGHHGIQEGEWALLDFSDFVVHVMQPATRDFYNLEGLWQDSNPSEQQP
jgi:ribosome-associated protein